MFWAKNANFVASVIDEKSSLFSNHATQSKISKLRNYSAEMNILQKMTIQKESIAVVIDDATEMKANYENFHYFMLDYFLFSPSTARYVFPVFFKLQLLQKLKNTRVSE